MLPLGTLRYSGCGWTFDDLEEATGISEEINHNFFHMFGKLGQDVLYPEYVKYLTTKEESSIYTEKYEMAGIHDAIGSMDVCHIILKKYSHRLKQNHLGGKSK